MNKVLKTPFIKNTMTTIKIISFTVSSCHIIPYDCATIYVNFIDENEIIYPRSFLLCEEEYDNWTTDDYLFQYINESIHTIFNS